MKKTLLILVAFVMTTCLTIKADDDRVITFQQLPVQAQTLLKTYFADKIPLIITVDRDDYTVRYQSGEKIEFNKKGDWKELECKPSAVPPALIPEAIKSHVQQSFPYAVIIKLNRDRRGYEVKLNNGLELEFDKKFQLVDIDD